MDNAVPAAPPAPPASSPPRRRPGARALLTLVNGVLAGVSSVYVGTRSLLITVIAAAVAVVLAVMVLAFQGNRIRPAAPNEGSPKILN